MWRCAEQLKSIQLTDPYVYLYLLLLDFSIQYLIQSQFVIWLYKIGNLSLSGAKLKIHFILWNSSLIDWCYRWRCSSLNILMKTMSREHIFSFVKDIVRFYENSLIFSTKILNSMQCMFSYIYRFGLWFSRTKWHNRLIAIFCDWFHWR